MFSAHQPAWDRQAGLADTVFISQKLISLGGGAQLRMKWWEKRKKMDWRKEEEETQSRRMKPLPPVKDTLKAHQMKI